MCVTAKRKGYKRGKKTIRLEEGEEEEIEIEMRKTTKRGILRLETNLN
jgi:hypothetical protein